MGVLDALERVSEAVNQNENVLTAHLLGYVDFVKFLEVVQPRKERIGCESRYVARTQLSEKFLRQLIRIINHFLAYFGAVLAHSGAQPHILHRR
ncbi:MAG TPA: hypothetical protein VFV34_18450 [Blastocatellia bacterium]|nr:hypothetical protein [Blastocatellia bacterium]